VQGVVLDFHPFDNPAGIHRSRVPHREDVTVLLSLLPGLKTLFLQLDDEAVLQYYPKVSDFENNSHLEAFTAKSWFHDTEEEEEEIDVFNWSDIRYFVEGEWGEPTVLYEEEYLPEVIVKLRRRSGSSFALRYFSEICTETEIDRLIRSTPLSRIHIVLCTHKSHLDRLLSNVGHLSLLTCLSLFSYDSTLSTTAPPIDFLLRFPNLTHLALGGTSLPTSLEFYDTLRQLPLKSLHFGPHSSVHVESVIDLLSSASKPNLASLKHLLLDNIDAYAPTAEEEDEANSWDWLAPEWTSDCSEAKVKELKVLATKLGIKIGGTTFKGLEVVYTSAYEAALNREEEEAEDEEEEEEETEEEETEEEEDQEQEEEESNVEDEDSSAEE